MRLLCVLQTLRTGGAQRVFSCMADEWIEQGHQVSLLLFTSESEPLFTPVHPEVDIHRLGILGEPGGSILGRIYKNLRRFPVVRNAIKTIHPDCAIGFMIDENLVLRLSSIGLSVPVILIEHSPFSYDPGYLKRMLRDIVYPQADGIVMLTQKAREHAVGNVRQKTLVIENPIQIPEAFASHRSDKSSESGLKEAGVFLAIGRLAVQKRFDRLIRAFSLIADRCAAWNLHIYGSGDQEESLQKLIIRMNLEDRVFLKGAVKEPWDALSSGDVFVMSSDTEGFPMALIEAMVCGLAVISTDCPTGPGELIVDMVNGLLVSIDESAIARAMLELAKDPLLRRTLGTEAMKITERLSRERIMKRYNQFLMNCMLERKGTLRL
jgi:GalNAc-alpha-(1->4)-GalNAc-alpha-(1->3)-diNAcBac-PP-undecaprenol alpha-1,4-N-acetyl-D-galactosaminyltransferase